MKVVHITKLPDGGATWCAMRISEALRKEGIDSSMLLMQGETADGIAIAEPDRLYRWHGNILARLLMKVLKFITRPTYEYYKWRRKRAEKAEKAFFTSPLTDYTRLADHPAIKEADIVHLHWIADFVDYPSFFRKIQKPIVWTIHDENPGLGGFHYRSHLQQANDVYRKLDSDYASIKKKAISNGKRPHLVAISTMMKRFFEHNDILSKCPITLIHNGVDGGQYKMYDKESSREKLNLPEGKTVFLFSSYDIYDKRKGLKQLIDALEALHDDSTLLICIGGYKDVPETGLDIRCTGIVRDKNMLSLYYSAADFFVLSSFQEAFAQTPLEAMSCGTPVISFPCSGAADLINEENGVLCDDFTTEALKNGIRTALGKTYDRQQIRESVLARFSYDKIARQYIELYKSLLNDK